MMLPEWRAIIGITILATVSKVQKHAVALTVLYAKTGSPLFKRDLFVLVGVTLSEEARGAVLHRHQRDAEWSQLRVGQGPGGHKRSQAEAALFNPTQLYLYCVSVTLGILKCCTETQRQRQVHMGESLLPV